MRFKDKEYISGLLLFCFYGMMMFGFASQGRSEFLDLSPYLFLLSSFVLLINHKYWDSDHLVAIFIICIIGFACELIIVNTNLLGENHVYGKSLGRRVLNTPLLSGVIWFSLIASANGLLRKFDFNIYLKSFFAALLILFIFVFMETSASQIDFWMWEGIEIPYKTYILKFVVWFGISYVTFKADIRFNTFGGTVVYISNLLFFAAVDSIVN